MYSGKYEELEKAAVGLKENMDNLRELKFHLQRAADIERFATTFAKFKVGDTATIAVDIDFNRCPGWQGNADKLARGCKVTIQAIDVSTHFEYGCQLEGRGPERSLFYMPDAWLNKSNKDPVSKKVYAELDISLGVSAINKYAADGWVFIGATIPSIGIFRREERCE